MLPKYQPLILFLLLSWWIELNLGFNTGACAKVLCWPFHTAWVCNHILYQTPYCITWQTSLPSTTEIKDVYEPHFWSSKLTWAKEIGRMYRTGSKPPFFTPNPPQHSVWCVQDLHSVWAWVSPFVWGCVLMWLTWGCTRSPVRADVGEWLPRLPELSCSFCACFPDLKRML